MIEEVLEKAKGLVMPTDEDRKRLESVASIMAERLDALEVKWEFGGSYAHGTWLPEDADIDVFLIFPPELGEKGVTERGLEVAKRALEGYPVRMRYAEHPYLEGFVEGVRVNLVPCADIKDRRWITAADRSPHHTKFMRERLDDRLRTDVRLLKKFMKVQRLYGAEIKIRGFSGYVCEVLAVRYGGFLETLQAASKWKRGEIVAIGEAERAKKLYGDRPLVIVDPIDDARNLALAISPAKVGRFIMLSRLFLSSPSMEFFERYIGWGGPLGENVICLAFPVPDHVEDVLWGELWKAVRAVRKQMGIMGYKVLRATVAQEGGEACIALLLDRMRKKLEVKKGPEVFMKDDARRFLLRHEKDMAVWVGEDLRLYSLTKHKWPTAKHAAEALLANPVAYGVARGIAEHFSKGEVLMPPFPDRRVIKEALRGLEEEDACPRR